MATKNLIPRGSGEGGIGITDTTWGQAYFDTGNFNKGLFVSGKNIQQVVSDVVAGGGLGGVWDSGPAGVIYYNGGNVGIGTTNPSTKLDVVNSSNTEVTSTFNNAGGSAPATIHIIEDEISQNHVGLFVGASDLSSAVLTTKHTSVGIGTRNPNGNLDINSKTTETLADQSIASIRLQNGFTSIFNSALINARTDDTTSGVTDYTDKVGLMFASMGNERMRIDSTGNVGIGTPSPTGLLEIRKDEDRNPATAHLKIMGGSGLNGNQVVTGSLYIDNGGPTNTVAKFYISQDITGGEVRIVSGSNGVKLTDGATAWTGISDETLKENISPLENVLDKIKDYRCVEYNLKESPEDKKIGFIAQDWVDDFNPIVHKDEEGLLGMKYTETIPVLLKAIQEQQQLIEDLKSRVKTLESK
jgi:hypothetical protein